MRVAPPARVRYVLPEPVQSPAPRCVWGVCSARTPEGDRAMSNDDADDLVLFRDVRVIRSTAPALLCRIGEKSVWLPRGHISGKLWCVGDRGKLFIRRWVARDRELLDLAPSISRSPLLVSRSPLPVHLHLVRRDPTHLMSIG